MPKPPAPPAAVSNRPRWAVLVFLVGFTGGIVALTYYYLLPALRIYYEARKNGDRSGMMAIRATSALLLTILLMILITGVMLTFRISRFFFPRNAPPRTQTKYVDAWAESAKRIQVPAEEGDEKTGDGE